MKQFISFVACLCIMTLSWVAFAYDIAVMPVRGTNMTPGQADAVGVLIAQQYAQESLQSVLAPDQVKAALGNGIDYPATAKTLGVSEYLEGTCVALDAKFIIAISRHAQTGALIHTATMVATTMDDMPLVASRMAKALILKTTVDETQNIDNVTRTEGEPQNFTSTIIPKGFKGSVIFPVASGVSLAPQASLAFDLRVEKRSYFFGFTAGFSLSAPGSGNSTGYGTAFADFSANWFMTHSSFAPYLGIGMSPRIIIGNNGVSSGVGFAPFAQLGVTFPRESRARAVIELRVAQNVLPMQMGYSVYNPPTTAGGAGTYTDAPSRYPTELSIQFGIVF